MYKKKLIIWGGTGNFKVLCELLNKKYDILAFFDRNPSIAEYNGIPNLGNFDSFIEWKNTRTDIKEIHFIVSIGAGYGIDRLDIHRMLLRNQLIPIKAIHDTAFVANNATIGFGSQIYANATICVDVNIGDSCIINTSASVDHECCIEDGATIGPGARLAGLVHVGKYADIYTGAIILPRLSIGEGAIIGAGAVILKDVKPYEVVVGNPGRVIKSRMKNK